MYDNHSLSSSGVIDAAPPLAPETSAADCARGALDAEIPGASASTAAKNAATGREIMNPHPPYAVYTPEDWRALTCFFHRKRERQNIVHATQTDRVGPPFRSKRASLHRSSMGSTSSS